MKKVIASSVLATSVLLPINVLGSTPISTYAASSQTVVIDQLVGKKALLTAANVNVRKGAGTEFNSISKVHTGQIVSVLASEKNSKGEIWYKVSYNSTEGWIISDFLKATTAIKGSNTTSGTTYVGTTQKIGKNAANMRSGATTSYKVVATIPVGTSLKILSAFTNAQNEVWFNVDYKGKKGWVTSDLFVLNATAGETATSMKVVNQTTIHKGATKNYDIVSTAKPGTTLVIHQEFTNALNEKWVQVTYATGKKGWMLASAFEEESIANKVVIKQTSVYSGATKSYKTVATLAVGTKLSIHQEFTNASKEKWYQVTYAVGKKGWVPADSFESVSAVPEPPSNEIPPVNEIDHVVIDTNIKVSVPVANMRSGPGIDFDVVTQSKQNDEFISSEYAADANQEKWYKVSTSNGDAWIHQSVISIVEKSDETPDIDEESGIIQRFNALMYTDSSFNSKIIVGLPRNTAFTILNELISDGTAWIKILTSQGVEGWIPDFEVNEDIPTKYGTKTSTVFSGASDTSKKVDTINLNTPVRVLRTLNGWVNIETQNEKRGWIQASLLSDGSPIQLTNGKTEVRNGQDYLVWSKPSKFKLTYTMPSTNVLRVYGNLSQINEIKSKVIGVDSMKVEQVAGGTSVLLITFNSNYTYTIRDSDKELTIKVVPKGLVGKKIIVDAGHGAKDPGAIGPNKVKEKDVTLATAKALKAELEAAGAIVVLTRSTDVFLELKERTDIANKSDYDAFISIHADSFNATSKGTTTYYNATVNFNGPKSLTLAKSIQSDLVKTIGTYNKGVKEQLFYVNRMNELPSVLVELAYISNPTEEAQLASVAFQKNAAAGIRKGLENYFNQ
ncbi:SH3 domain-containing protein [Psychrobacillus sp. L3]|uniref:SH3 domain-containing protein n=1 Tax=Psychrobacillus sp. L3 TaxID=3236891 RepID=UPI0036F30A7E